MATKAQLEGLVPNAPFIFRGTVQQTGVSEVANLRPHAGTVVVKVEEVFRAPEVLGNLIGNRVTVHLSQQAPLPVGRQYVFFAAPLVYGENIAVRELGHVEVPKGIAQRNLVSSIGELVRQEPDRQLQDRLGDAECVVSGKVIEVRRIPRPPGSPITFDDPDWHDAVIQVDEVLAGKAPGERVVVTFPMSKDISWYRTPKFYVGQEGVWILRKHEFPRLKKTGYVAFHPFDFQPREKVEHVRMLAAK